MIGRGDVLLLLREKGASLTARDMKGRTPVAWASIKGHDDIVRYLLLQPEINPSQADFSNDTPLHFAAGQGRAEIVMMLCGCPSVNVNARNTPFGMTPLALAAWGGRFSVVQCLREFGADIHVSDSKGLTPLHYAAQQGFVYLVEFLVREGASISKRNNERLTPLDLAASDQIRELLLKTKRRVPTLQTLCLRTIRSNISEEKRKTLKPHLQEMVKVVEYSM